MDIIASLNAQVWIIVKIALLFALVIYIIFAYVIVKQVGLMTNTLELGHERVVKLLAAAHLAFAVGVFVFALFAF